MDPFAYQKKKGTNSSRKVILLGLAAVSVSIWYFDLVPQLAPVPTGDLQPVTEDALHEDDFLELLRTAPDEALTAGMKTEAEVAVENEGLLQDALANQSEPPSTIEDDFPEFASASEPTGAVQQASYEVTQNERPAAAADPVPPSPPAVLSAAVAGELKQVDLWIAAGETLEAHAALSRLYWKQPALRGEIRDRIETTAAEIYANPATHFADPRMVAPGETLGGIAKEFKVPWQYLARLNRTSPERLQAGQTLKVLTGPFGAVVDLDEFELTIHAHGWFVRRYQIGIGADGATPPGEYTVQDKLENPTWHNPAGGVVSGDDPANPLGEYWLGLGNHLGIHGTIDPGSIGRATSRGCLHLSDGDIAEIYQLLGVGSPVVIRR